MPRRQKRKGWHVCPPKLGFGDRRARPDVGVTLEAMYRGAPLARERMPVACHLGFHAESSPHTACIQWGSTPNRLYLDEVLVEGDLDFHNFKEQRKFSGRKRTALRRVHRNYVKLALASLGVYTEACVDLGHMARATGWHTEDVVTARQLFKEAVELAFWLQKTITSKDPT